MPALTATVVTLLGVEGEGRQPLSGRQLSKRTNYDLRRIESARQCRAGLAKAGKASANGFVEKLGRTRDDFSVRLKTRLGRREQIVKFAQGSRLAMPELDDMSDRNPADIFEPAGFGIAEIDQRAVGDAAFVETLIDARREDRSRHRRGGDEVIGLMVIKRWRSQRTSREPHSAFVRPGKHGAIFADYLAVGLVAPAFDRRCVEARMVVRANFELGRNGFGIIEIAVEDGEQPLGNSVGRQARLEAGPSAAPGRRSEYLLAQRFRPGRRYLRTAMNPSDRIACCASRERNHATARQMRASPVSRNEMGQ